MHDVRASQSAIHPRRDLEAADMDFIIAATEKNLMMVEGESEECSEEDLVKALELAHEAIKIQIIAQEELRDAVGVKEKRDYPSKCSPVGNGG